jgi:hypothetical protein
VLALCSEVGRSSSRILSGKFVIAGLSNFDIVLTLARVRWGEE